MNEKFSKEIKFIKMNQSETLELKNSVQLSASAVELVRQRARHLASYTISWDVSTLQWNT